MEKIVITYGTFDLFHIGHLRILERARAVGSKLIVAVSTDEFNASKGKRSIIPFQHRAEILRGLRCVDEVIPESCWEQKALDIRKHGVSALVMGDDWKGKFDDLKAFCEVVYIERTDGISSTQLKSSLSPLTPEHAQDLKSSIDLISQIIHSLQLD